jgi:hypothetical protein
MATLKPLYAPKMADFSGIASAGKIMGKTIGGIPAAKEKADTKDTRIDSTNAANVANTAISEAKAKVAPVQAILTQEELSNKLDDITRTVKTASDYKMSIGTYGTALEDALVHLSKASVRTAEDRKKKFESKWNPYANTYETMSPEQQRNSMGLMYTDFEEYSQLPKPEEAKTPQELKKEEAETDLIISKTHKNYQDQGDDEIDLHKRNTNHNRYSKEAEGHRKTAKKLKTAKAKLKDKEILDFNYDGFTYTLDSIDEAIEEVRRNAVTSSEKASAEIPPGAVYNAGKGIRWSNSKNVTNNNTETSNTDPAPKATAKKDTKTIAGKPTTFQEFKSRALAKFPESTDEELLAHWDTLK